MAGPRSASRRLFLWFIAATVPATLALMWLGWAVVQQDRVQSRNRHEALREQHADVGVATLARTLTELEDLLGASAAPALTPPTGPLLAQIPILTFDSQGVSTRHGLMLPYSPAVSRPAVALPASFDLADDLEFARSDSRGAIVVVSPFSRDDRPAIRAEAWLRLARNYRKVGDVDRALSAFHELSLLGDAMVQGVPAGLMGRNGRLLIFEAGGRARELRQEAAALREQLTAGRWRITENQFEQGITQVSRWLGRDIAEVRPPIDDERRNLLGAADAVWREGVRIDRIVPRRTIRVNGASVLALTRPVPKGIAVMLVSAPVLQRAWHGHLTPAVRDMTFALIDPEGRHMVGTGQSDPLRLAVRTMATSGLPWTLTAADRNPADPAALSFGARMMLAGVALMLTVVVISGYTIVRAVSREMRVARLQADFVAAVSHEFRTPLTTIRQLSEMLAKSRVSTGERRQEFYEAILSESERLKRLVEGLLDFGRMEAGRMTFRVEPVNLGSVVHDVAASVGRDAPGYRIDVAQIEDVPPVRGDGDAIGHAIRNLLDNAIKYSPEHKVVAVSVTRDHDHVSVRVRDRGLGIPVSEQRDIFQKFVRGAGSTSRNIAGTGIGLAMARQIVEAHHGTLSVESAPGEGSTFTINLPVETVSGV